MLYFQVSLLEGLAEDAELPMPEIRDEIQQPGGSEKAGPQCYEQLQAGGSEDSRRVAPQSFPADSACAGSLSG